MATTYGFLLFTLLWITKVSAGPSKVEIKLKLWEFEITVVLYFVVCATLALVGGLIFTLILRHRARTADSTQPEVNEKHGEEGIFTVTEYSQTISANKD